MEGKNPKEDLDLERGNRVKTSRINANLTQDELAFKIGKTKSSISFFEKGGGFTMKTAKKLSEILKVNQQWLLTGEGNASRPSIFLSHSSEDSDVAQQVLKDATFEPNPTYQKLFNNAHNYKALYEGLLIKTEALEAQLLEKERLIESQKDRIAGLESDKSRLEIKVDKLEAKLELIEQENNRIAKKKG